MTQVTSLDARQNAGAQGGAQASPGSPLPLPTGGNAPGYGEAIGDTGTNGALTWSMPVPVTAARDAEPRLFLNYSSTGGNGAFGTGFDIAIPAFSLRTDDGVPRYDGRDPVQGPEGDELVPAYEQDDGQWRLVQGQRSAGGRTYTVTRFRPRLEESFDLIERWVDTITQESFWQVTDAASRVSVYGRSANARVAAPGHPQRVFRWLLESVIDAHGNESRYHYKLEDRANVPNVLYEEGHGPDCQRYLSRIEYGNWIDPAVRATRFGLQVLFDYGEYDLDSGSAEPVREWAARPDPFSNFRAGFEIRTRRRCLGVLMAHQFPALRGGQPTLVHALRFTYEQERGVSQLKSVRRHGYRHQDDGRVTTQAMAPITFGYWGFDGAASLAGRVGAAPQDGPPLLQDHGEYSFADLLGDGVPGVLGADGDRLLYWPPAGSGALGRAMLLPELPVNHVPQAGVALMDLSGAARLDMAVLGPDMGGVYVNNQDGTWQPFRAFESYTNRLADPGAELLDLNGNGKSDVVVLDASGLAATLSRGESGYQGTLVAPLPADFPRGDDPGAALVTYADVFGDGLQHRIRLADGSLEVWPALGWGRYGRKISMTGAPRFATGLPAGRVLFGNFAGNGVADLLVVGETWAELYPNANGNAFLAPIRVPLPGAIDERSRFGLADLFGTGRPCLTISRTGGPFASHYLRFGALQPPRALRQVDNGRGMVHTVTYRPAADGRLADQAAGEAWVTRLPVPQQVVETIVAHDAVEGSTQTRAFQYRNGYWNPLQKSFGGFGEVVLQDTVGYDPMLWRFRATAALGGELDPQCQRVWNQTGAYVEAEALAADMARRSFGGDPDALVLPAASFAPDILAADAATQAEAYYVLRGRRSRAEVYSARGGLTAAIPYSVEQTACYVRMLQPRLDGNPAVFQVSERETATAFYEQQADDPRIEHAIVTAQTPYGQPEQTVVVNYPRRSAAGRRILPGQDQLRVVCRIARYRNTVTPYYQLGIEYASEMFEIANARPASGLYFSFAALAAQVSAALANIVPFGQPFGADAAARPFGATRTYFWNDGQTACLPLGEASRQALACRTQHAVFPEQYADAVYGARVNAAMLEQDCRYKLEDGYWWSVSGLASYLGADGFYQPFKLQDAFQAGGSLATVTQFDECMLAPVQVTDPLGQAVRATLDYQLLVPASVTDVNGIVSEVLFDPLGRVVVSATHGTVDGKYAGNMSLAHYRLKPATGIDQVLADPGAYLQGAGMYFYYGDYADEANPQHQLTLVGADYVDSPSAQTPAGAVRMGVAWQDGAGKEACSKVAVEADFAPAQDLPAGAGALVWIVGSRQQLDPRGNPIKRFLPYFSASPGFEPLPRAGGFRYHYDALDRVIRTDLPDGHYTKNVYAAWAQFNYDENDTTPGRFDYDTPAALHLDNRGLAVVHSQTNVRPDDPTRAELNELTVRDIAGQVVMQCDARFYNAADPLHPARWNFTYTYDMQGNVLAVQSIDGGDATPGTALTLHTSAGDTARTWNARGAMSVFVYELAIRRERALLVTEDGVERTSVAYAYGAEPARNNVNQPVVTLDPAGRLDSPDYDLSGAPRAMTRKFCAQYQGPVDWSDPAKVQLEPREWVVRIERNGLGEVTQETMCDGAVNRPRRYLNGLVRAVDAQWAGAPAVATVAAMKYGAMGERLEVAYDNGITTALSYVPGQPRLQRVVSTRASDGARVQDLGYQYDPVGNVVAVTNGVEPLRFARGQAVAAQQTFGYDAVYQLLAATGRCSVSVPACGPGSAGAAPNDAGQVEAYSRSYTYDAGGNLTRVRHQAGSGQWNHDIAVSATSNHAVPASMVQPGHGSDDFFDAAGNLARLDTLAALDYDERNQLVKATIVGRPGSTDDADYFVYDASGVRVRKVSVRMAQGGATQLVTDVLYVGGAVVSTVTSTAAGAQPRVLAQVEEAAVQADGFCLARSARQVQPAGGARSFRYPLVDLQNSVVIETGKQGEITTYREYFPYGCLAIANGGWMTESPLPRYRYIGREHDEATGFACFAHRYYIPWMGRWLTTDPSGPVDRLNLYQYADNNPMTLVDPLGYSPEDAARLWFALRYMSSAEYSTAFDIANQVFNEAYANKQLFVDESARFSKALEGRLLNFFGEFIFAFAAGNAGLADAFESAGSTPHEANSDRRNAYKSLRTAVNKSLATAFPELDFTPQSGQRPFEMHHLLYKANHPRLATTTFNFAMTTRGSTSSGMIGTHEGAFHLITSGNDSSIYTREIAGVIGVIKRMIAGAEGINLSTTTPTGANAWLALTKNGPYSKPSTTPTTTARAKSVRAQLLSARKREQSLGIKRPERFLQQKKMSPAMRRRFDKAAREAAITKARQKTLKNIQRHMK